MPTKMAGEGRGPIAGLLDCQITMCFTSSSGCQSFHHSQRVPRPKSHSQSIGVFSAFDDGARCSISTAGASIASNSAEICGDSVNCAAARFSRRWAMDEVPGMRRMFGARRSSQASATCIGVASKPEPRRSEVRRLQRGEAAKRKERHICDAVAGELIDQGIIRPMRQVVVVLHADDLADPASFLDLRGRNVAQSDVTYQALCAGVQPER